MTVCDTFCLGHGSIALSQRMIEALERFQIQTLKAAGGVYIYDMVDQCTLCTSYSTAEMLGYAADDRFLIESMGLDSLIHPDDLTRVAEYYQSFTRLQPKDVITVDYRMKRADGTWCHLHSQETPLVTAINGFPLQVLGFIQDVSQGAQPPVRRFTVFEQVLYSVN